MSGSSPPKAGGGGAKAPIFDVSHDEQVDLLAQALLREYMHRKKFKATLESFDQENPRNEKTVSQRSVMGDLMYLSADVQSALKARGIETIMEMLCAGRVEKRAKDEKLKHLRDVIKREVPTIPVELLQPLPPLPPPPAAAASEKPPKKDKKKDKGEPSSRKDDDSEKKKKQKKNTLTIDDLLDMSDDDGPAHKAPPAPAAAKPTATKQQQLVDVDIPTAQRLKPADAQKQQQQQRQPPAAKDPASPSAPADNSSSSGDDDDEEDYATALKRIRQHEEAEAQRQKQQQQQQAKTKGGSDAAGAGKRSGWDAPAAAATAGTGGDRRSSSSSGGGALGQPIASSASSPPRPQQPAAAPLPLPPTYPCVGLDVAKAVKNCLVGGDRRIPNSFLQQGFTYSQAVRYGLVQHEGGPCGALAAVQGFALVHFAASNFADSAEVQQAALVQALASILLIAANAAAGGKSGGSGDVGRVFVCDAVDHFPTKKSDRNFSADHIRVIAAMATKTNFASRRDLETHLAALLTASSGSDDAADERSWSAPEGSGLMAFLTSLLLTRGGFGGRQPSTSGQDLLASITADQDLETALIVEHGYCSQELVNLIVQGRATSNVHDGTITSGGGDSDGGIALHGLFGPLPVGCLSFLEHRGLIQVGQAAKEPLQPIWLVYHESHYTTLFMKADVRTKISASAGGFTYPTLFDVYFWDQQGQQDDEVRLTVHLDPNPLPPVPKHALVPYLNDILRTLPAWSKARVNWNGTDPLL